MVQITNDEVYNALGSVFELSEAFDGEDDVRAYFSRENFIQMFRECNYSDEEMDELQSLAVRLWEEEKSEQEEEEKKRKASV